MEASLSYLRMLDMYQLDTRRIRQSLFFVRKRPREEWDHGGVPNCSP